MDAPNDVITPDAVIGPSSTDSEPVLDLGSMLGPLAALVPPELLSMVEQLAPDPDAASLDDVDESINELHGKVERIAEQLGALCDLVEQLGEAFASPLARAGITFALRRVEL